MTAIPDELEQQLRAHETRRDDAAGAREVLEAAIVLQARAVADGLLADMLLRGQSFDGPAWWCQYLSRQERPLRYLLDPQDPAFRSYRQDFARKIAASRIARIGLGSLDDLPVRVLGGHCRFADEGKVNGQLVRLGSSLRSILVGSSRVRMTRMRSMLGERAGTTESLDGRFILGHIGPISHFCNASLYLLERELAVSPYMEARASGFTDGARIVVRQDVLRGRVEEEEHKGNVAASSDLEQLLHSMTESVLVHESAHILFDGARVSRGTDGVTLWRSAAREDLLRFAQIPHTLEEFQAAFAEYFGEKNTRINVMMGPAFDIRRPADGFTVERELAALRSEGLLFVDRDHRYYSTIHGRGQPWTL